MTTELFNLSERLINQEFEKWKNGYPIYHTAILLEDVKEFIRLFDIYISKIHNDIDKQFLRKYLYRLAGNKLIGEKDGTI